MVIVAPPAVKTIDFPMWVKTTKCKTMTNSVVFPRSNATPHGADKVLIDSYAARLVGVQKNRYDKVYPVWESIV